MICTGAQVIMNPDSGRQRGIGGEKKNEGNEVKSHLLLMKYKAL